tara:strand:+ start:98 stop:430 length:333 start_codon:yes stop_codon:yes gene_type:complete
MMIIQPVSIELLDDILKIHWNDDKKTKYEYQFLRESCPCASCVGEPGIFKTSVGILNVPRDQPNNPPIPKTIKPKNLKRVGNYAITISWSDGHSSGIYSYDYLRKLSTLN